MKNIKKYAIILQSAVLGMWPFSCIFTVCLSYMGCDDYSVWTTCWEKI